MDALPFSRRQPHALKRMDDSHPQDAVPPGGDFLDSEAEPAEELSLDALSMAFAETLHGHFEPPAENSESPSPETEEEAAEPEEPQDSCPLTPRTIFEAMLFVGSTGNRPLTSREVAALLRGVSAREIEELVVELNELYAREGHPYEIAAEGGGFRLVLRGEFDGVRNQFYGRVREAKLSQAAVDVLAIVAYSQPVTREEVDRLRGKPSGGLLAQLVRRELLRLERREEDRRHPRYHTTDRFLQLFGLGTIRDLPKAY